MAVGTVKWFNAAKGYGFIVPQDGGKDVFVHIKEVQAAGLHHLDEGQKISFDVSMERGQAAAANVKLLDGTHGTGGGPKD
jgi:CspA family cold shock protein